MLHFLLPLLVTAVAGDIGSRDKIDEREISRLLLTPQLSEVTYTSLASAPASIAWLVHLLVAARQHDDFSIADGIPPAGVKYMQHPDSFQKSLIEINQAAYGSIMNAYNNMIEVKNIMKMMPIYIRKMVMSVFYKNPEVQRSKFKWAMDRVNSSISESIAMGNRSKNSILATDEKINEMLIVFQNSEEAKTGEISAAQIAIEIAEAQKSQRKSEIARHRIQAELIEAKQSVLESEFKRRLDEIPSGWRTSYRTYYRAFWFFFTESYIVGTRYYDDTPVHSLGSDNQQPKATHSNEYIEVMASANSLLSELQNIRTLLRGFAEDRAGLKPRRELNQLKNGITYMKLILKTIDYENLGFDSLIDFWDVLDKGNSLAIKMGLRSINETFVTDFDEWDVHAKVAVLFLTRAHADSIERSNTIRAITPSPLQKFTGHGNMERMKAHEAKILLLKSEREEAALRYDLRSKMVKQRIAVARIIELSRSGDNLGIAVEVLKMANEFMLRAKSHWMNFSMFFMNLAGSAHLQTRVFNSYVQSNEDSTNEDVSKRDIQDATIELIRAAGLVRKYSRVYLHATEKYIVPMVVQAHDAAVSDSDVSANSIRIEMDRLAKATAQELEQFMNSTSTHHDNIQDQLGRANIILAQNQGPETKEFDDIYNKKATEIESNTANLSEMDRMLALTEAENDRFDGR